MMKLDPKLEQYATEKQWEKLKAWESEGSQSRAAEKIGVAGKSLIHCAYKSVLKKAAMQGYHPESHMVNPVPDPFMVKGVSQYYDKYGNPGGQWVKSSIDAQKQQEAQEAAIRALCTEIKPVAPSSGPQQANKSLLTKYVFTDCHVGMMAWHREGGDNWDLKIAEQTLCGAMQDAINRSPDAETGYVLQLGDFLHFDGLAPVTPTNHHVLDADGRFGKVVEYAIRIIRNIIDMALAKHKIVKVVIAEGNHDLASSVWLRKMFQALYQNEPRVQFIDSELPYYAFQFGKVMLASHHGHMKKGMDLDRMMPAQFPEIWGATKYRYCDNGHEHHRMLKEEYGMVKEQHPTLAAKDAYAARHGYHALRSMFATTYHENFGEVSRISVMPEMFLPVAF